MAASRRTMYFDSLNDATSTVRVYNARPRIFDGALIHSNSLFLKDLSACGDKIVFSRPILFVVEHDDNGFYAQNKELNVYAYGRNTLSLLEAIHDEILWQWKLYANELDEGMTLDAQKLKQNLRELVALKESVINHA